MGTRTYLGCQRIHLFLTVSFVLELRAYYPGAQFSMRKVIKNWVHCKYVSDTYLIIVHTVTSHWERTEPPAVSFYINLIKPQCTKVNIWHEENVSQMPFNAKCEL